MKKLLFVLVALLLASNAMADRVVVFDPDNGAWPAGVDPFDLETIGDEINLSNEFVDVAIEMAGFPCFTLDGGHLYYAANSLTFTANKFSATPDGTSYGIKKIVFDCYNFSGLGGAGNISIVNEYEISNGEYDYEMNDYEHFDMSTSTGTFVCSDDGRYPPMVAFEGECYIYKITVYIDAEEDTDEPTLSPSIRALTQPGVHAYFLELEPSEDSEIYYRFRKDHGAWSDWFIYLAPVAFTEDGFYEVEAYAICQGKDESNHVSVSFEVTPRTGLDEMNCDKNVAGVRYYNMAGQEMPQANGMTIQVTTYTDGTNSVSKIVK